MTQNETDVEIGDSTMLPAGVPMSNTDEEITSTD